VFQKREDWAIGQRAQRKEQDKKAEVFFAQALIRSSRGFRASFLFFLPLRSLRAILLLFPLPKK
jgi:hypothetical protein